MFLKYVCNERTIEWEVVYAVSIILPYDLDVSPCWDASRIKRLTDAFIGRVITALRAAVLGIITPWGDTIQVVCPLFLGSGFAGLLLQLVSRWEWLWCYQIGAHDTLSPAPAGLGSFIIVAQ